MTQAPTVLGWTLLTWASSAPMSSKLYSTIGRVDAIPSTFIAVVARRSFPRCRCSGGRLHSWSHGRLAPPEDRGTFHRPGSTGAGAHQRPDGEAPHQL